jgi:hypothetical protein
MGFENRIAALERSLFRWRLLAFVILGLVSLCLLVGADAARKVASFDTVTCRKLVIVDGNGEPRIAALTVVDPVSQAEYPTLSLMSDESKPVITLAEFPQGDGGHIDVHDRAREYAASMRASKDVALFAVSSGDRTLAGIGGLRRVVWSSLAIWPERPSSWIRAGPSRGRCHNCQSPNDSSARRN